MFSLDPTMGKDGYPLLFQTGETADGTTPLIDRQHPHDFLMELAAVYSHTITATSSVFLYAGYPGEPALGPPTFMHRFSGMDNPEAPLGHHWLDATHITFGVLTGGVVVERVQARRIGVQWPRAGRVALEFRSAAIGFDVAAADLESDAQLVDAGELGLAQLARSTGAGHRSTAHHRVGELQRAA